MKEPLLYKIVRPLLTLWMKITFRPTYINKKVIPKKGRVLLVGNHINNFDCVLLGSSTKRCIRYIAKDSLTKGFIGPIFKGLGIVPVNRKIHDKTVIPTAVKLLEYENIVGIFPEGTINRTNEIVMPFKPGAIKMSIESNSEIIPFAITGQYKMFRKNATIVFGEPYMPQTKEIEKEMKILETKVIELLNAGVKK